MFCGILTFIPVALSCLFSMRLCRKLEQNSKATTRILTYILASIGFYPQYLAIRSLHLLLLIKEMTKTLKLFRTILTGVGYLEGNWKVCRDRAQKVNIIEPVLEGVMQLFFQSIILYIVYGPGTSKIQSILVLFKMSILSS